jgi:hypothetical protein
MMKVCCYTEKTEKGILFQFPSKAVKQKMLDLFDLARKKSNGYMTIDFGRVYKSRTTGKGSQNNLFYELATEICKETGNELEDVKDALKERAIKRGYPYKINPINNQIKPFSTTKINTVEMGYLIDEAKQLCAELGIVLSPDMEQEEEPKTKENNTDDYDIF